jgi:hypothetical protein
MHSEECRRWTERLGEGTCLSHGCLSAIYKSMTMFVRLFDKTW